MIDGGSRKVDQSGPVTGSRPSGGSLGRYQHKTPPRFHTCVRRYVCMRRVVVIFLMVGLTAAQSGLPAFDVASVKPSHAATGNMQLGPGGRVEILASTLKSIIRWAYDIGEY